MTLYTLHYITLDYTTLHYIHTNSTCIQTSRILNSFQGKMPNRVHYQKRLRGTNRGDFLTSHEGVVVQHQIFVYKLIFVWICNLPRCDTKWYLLCFLTWFTQLKCPKCPKLVAGLCGLAVSPCCCFWQIGWRTRAGQPGATISVCPNYWSLKIMVEYQYSLTKQLRFRESSRTGWSSITNHNRTYGYNIGIPRRSSILLNNSRTVSC